MYLKFDNMMLGYPTFYLIYQSFFILAISIFHDDQFAIYVVLGLQVVYLVVIVIVRPYNTVRNFNRFLHNIAIIYHQLALISVVVVVLWWNTVYSTQQQIDSNMTTTALAILIIFFLLLSLVFAILRICIFNQEVALKCCKKEEEELHEEEKK